VRVGVCSVGAELLSGEIADTNAAWLLRRVGAVTTPHLIDGGEGIRLHGMHSHIPGRTARGLALLLHGWEGSVESSYMRLTAARLLARGFDVFRLNFRDHGDTYHLHQALFHSNRIDEVVHAAGDIARRFSPREAAPGKALPGGMVVAGYSLGGNFGYDPLLNRTVVVSSAAVEGGCFSGW
jgi:predicted alpha/beta-fold hydrolase